MATQTPTFESSTGGTVPREKTRLNSGSLLSSILMPLASLKLTVVLFALSILIVLFGTLAQARADIWDVINEYFRVDFSKAFSSSFPWIFPKEFFVSVPLQIFFPPAFTKVPWTVSGAFWFPKGWLIGLMMGINLFAAHAVRFKTQARGSRLLIGLFVLAFGIFVTWAVIVSGSGKDVIQNKYSISWETLWRGMQFSLIGLVGAMGYGLFSVDPTRKWHRYLLMLGVGLATPLLVWMFWNGSDVPIDDSGMRILWQLVKGTAAGVVLLIGCILIFKKRAGIVLLHGGIGLMMFYEVLVGVAADEGQMQIFEGQTVNYADDIRSVELAVIKPVDDKTDQVTVVPQSVIREHLPDSDDEGNRVAGEPISHDELPFDMRIEEYYQNAQLVPAGGVDQKKVTGGLGKERRPEPLAGATGASSDQRADRPAAYIAIYEKGKHDEPVSRNLVSVQSSMMEHGEEVTVGGESYEVFLRFKRLYKPYSVTLLDAEQINYEGTSTPRDFSSQVRVVDDETDSAFSARIWMNNPLRYGGETLYQSGLEEFADGPDVTVLQVVTNTGWMIPYVSCMIVAVGMLAQFLMTLIRFLNRRAGSSSPSVETTDVKATPASPPRDSSLDRRQNPLSAWFPLAVVLLTCLYLAPKFNVSTPPDDQYNVYRFGQIPVRDKGRLKPLDSLAQNTLRFLSRKIEFVDYNETKQPATRFLLDLMTPRKVKDPESGEMVFAGTRADDYKVFYIESLEAQKFLKLEKRKGFLYSYSELQPQMPALREKMTVVFAIMKGEQLGTLKLVDHDLREVHNKIEEYHRVREGFLPIVPPDYLTFEDFQTDRTEAKMKLARVAELVEQYPQVLKGMEAPLLIPAIDTRGDFEPGNPDYQGKWQPFTESYLSQWFTDFLLELAIKMEFPGKFPEPDPANPLTVRFQAIRDAYEAGEAEEFNSAVVAYLGYLGASPPPDLDEGRIRYEAYFNKTSIYYYAAVVSLFAFILGLLSWIGWSEPLRRAAFGIILVLLVVHIYGLSSRIYISGRPPVTNLYSSALFIGGGAIALGLLLEWLYPIGIAVVISSAMSFGTLLIAQFLSIGGDTIGVLQAVLDTQFWLATHVVCITFGYATTFLAGFLGLAYFVRGMLTPTLTRPLARDLTRMIYGILCFSIFFSFVGTVLGGLWADDSWGRFWGWDPKENGALIIVLWNALVLHARWGGLVKDRGLAILAMGGNIATSWSWFGVNELGVGLHAYGFTKGVLFALSTFCIIQLSIILVAAVIPQKKWWSFQRQQLDTAR